MHNQLFHPVYSRAKAAASGCRRSVLIGVFTALLTGLASCTTIPDSAALITVPTVETQTTQGTPAEVETSYPPISIKKSPAAAYPYPHPIQPSEIATIASMGLLTPEPEEMIPTPSPVAVVPPVEPLIPIYSLDMTFIDRSQGWMIGDAVWNDNFVVAIATTSDGGTTWQAVPIPPAIQAPWSGAAFWLRATGQVKYLFTSADSAWLYQNSLLHTFDGGKTWVEQRPRGTILQMGKAVDGFYWALEQAGDNLILWQISADSYDHWNKLSDQFPEAADQKFLAVLDAQHFYISHWVSFAMDKPNPGTELFKTNDSGKNWEKIVPPEPCDDLPTVVSPLSPQELWIGCGFPAGAGSGTSAIFMSLDGGQSWLERKQDTQGYLMNLRAVSNSFIYATYERASSVTLTHDGGKTWEETQISCFTYVPKADFIDESYGWAACDRVINRTVDGGGHWECIELTSMDYCLPVIGE